MKLTKDQTQKIALGAMMFCAVVYAYFEFALSPLAASQAAAHKNVAALEPKIKEAREQLNKTKALEAKEKGAQLLLDQVGAMIPEGSPIAWFPTRITELFKKAGVEKMAIRIVNEYPEKDMPGFGRITWAAEIPKAEFVEFATAVAALENGEPLVEVQSFEVEAGREDPLNQKITVSLVSLVRL